MKVATFNKMERSFMKILNSIGPKMDPCGTPEIIDLRMPTKLLTLTACFRSLKYEQTSFTISQSRPYASSFAIINHEEIVKGF